MKLEISEYERKIMVKYLQTLCFEQRHHIGRLQIWSESDISESCAADKIQYEYLQILIKLKEKFENEEQNENNMHI